MPFSDSNSINTKIFKRIDTEDRSYYELEDGGILFLEHTVPYLFIHVVEDEADDATIRITKSGASYLIIRDIKQFDYSKLLEDLCAHMSAKFGSYLLVSIYCGEHDSTSFVVRGPSEKLPASIEVLEEELKKIDSRRFGVHLDALVEDTKERFKRNKYSLIGIEELKRSGGVLLGIELPPVYKNHNGGVFPIYFRKFRDDFFRAVQKSVFEFVRVQTSCGIHNYNALGKRDVHKELYRIDREISEIQSSYQFLLLVAPVNIQQMRKKFFETNFKELDDYHYRLLPVDPDILKRKLFNLEIDQIDDPALSFLYNEKREEVEQELTMLKERGTKNFFYSSVRLYGTVDNDLLKDAKRILREIKENEAEESKELISAADFEKIAKKEFDYFRESAPEFGCKVHIRDDVNIIMVSRGELYIPSDYKMTKQDSNALVQHEIGTHVLTYYNGSRQPLSQLAIGLANYDPLQEGIAVLAEYFADSLSGNRLRVLAGRVVAGSALMEGKDFKETFHLLMEEYHFTKDRAFNITSRMFQGGGFLKDIIYLKGLSELKRFLQEGGQLEKLLSGKFALKHIPIIEELTERTILKPAELIPRYLTQKGFKKRLDKFKNDESLSKMIKK